MHYGVAMQPFWLTNWWPVAMPTCSTFQSLSNRSRCTLETLRLLNSILCAVLVEHTWSWLLQDCFYKCDCSNVFYIYETKCTIHKYLFQTCKKMKLFMWLQRIMLFSDNDVYTQITNKFQSICGRAIWKMSLFPYSMVSYLEPQNLSLEGIDTRELQARLSGQYLGHFRWFGSFKGCSPSPYHPCMVYLYYLH